MTRIIKFSSVGCGQCRQLQKFLDKFNYKVDEELDINKSIDEVKKYSIASLPTLIKLDDNGEEIDRIVGIVTPARIREFFES